MSDYPEPGWHKPVGITLALASSIFIGSSFIIKKKGLLQTNALGHKAGQSYAYLRNYMWWTGMIFMAIGEIANFGAYAILVTPLGAVSVVLSAILSSIFLKERLDFSAKIGCAQCLLGALIIVLNAPDVSSTTTIIEFFDYLLHPCMILLFKSSLRILVFLVYSFMIISIILYLIIEVSPIYGEEHPVVYISICALVGAFLVLCTQGFGSAVVYSFSNWHTDNQFLHWQLYLVFFFVVITIMMQISYLNKAINLFSTAIVSPVYYVFFTTATIITSAVFHRGFQTQSTVGMVSLFIGFLVIVGGVSLLFHYNLSQNLVQKSGASNSEFGRGGLEIGKVKKSVSVEDILLNSIDSEFLSKRVPLKFATSELTLLTTENPQTINSGSVFRSPALSSVFSKDVLLSDR